MDIIKKIFNSVFFRRDLNHRVNCMILGAAKSGTTSLAQYMSMHPDIAMGPTKELHYFDWRYDHSYEWYEGLFKSRKKYQLDATPYYLFHPLIPSRIKAYNPTCKFIVLFRNPVDRAISHYFHNIKIRGMKDKELSHWRAFLPLDEELPIVEAFHKEEERIQDQYALVQEHAQDRTYHNHILQHFSYKARGHYAEQLKRWFDLFPIENFLVLDFDDLTDDPEKTLAEVYTFLNLKPIFPKHYEPSNRGSYEVDQVIEQLKEELSNYYQSHDKALFDLTKRRFRWMKKE